MQTTEHTIKKQKRILDMTLYKVDSLQNEEHIVKINTQKTHIDQNFLESLNHWKVCNIATFTTPSFSFPSPSLKIEQVLKKHDIFKLNYVRT